jgi:hypothetical protein
MGYRSSFGNNPISQTFVEPIGGNNIHRDAEEVPKLTSYGPDIEQRCLRCGVDQKVEIALFGVLPMEDGSEDARICRTARCNDPANLVSMQIQSLRRSHELLPTT